MSCSDCFRGASRADKAPEGQTTTVHGRNTYIAQPGGDKKPTGSIVIVPDAFGWEFVNNRLLADEYARKGGFTVYLPDFMDGTAAPLWVIDTLDSVFDVGSVRSWLVKPYHVATALYGMGPFAYYNRLGVSLPKVDKFLTALQSADPVLPIGVAGFCWGGQHIVHLAKHTSGAPVVEALFTAHPSMLAVPKDIEAIKQPVAIAIGDSDHLMPIDQVNTVKSILTKNKIAHDVVIYEGAGHGFSVRIDRKNPKQETHAIQAEEQAIAWFKKCFDEKKGIAS